MVLMIPSVLNMLAVYKSAILLAVASVASIPLVVALLPEARHHENMFVFFVTTIGMIPMNLKITQTILSTGFADGFTTMSTICYCILLYWIVFNCEQIVLGFVTRAICPRQHKLFHLKEDSNE